jgi:hypothetical protein
MSRSIGDLALFLRDASGMYATLYQFSGERPIVSVSLFDDVTEAARELWTVAEEDVYGLSYYQGTSFGGSFYYRVRVAGHGVSYSFICHAWGGRTRIGKWWGLEPRRRPGQHLLRPQRLPWE